MADYSFNTVGSIAVARGGAARIDEFRPGQAAAAARVLLVTDPFLEQSGLTAPAVAALEAAGAAVTLFSGVEPDPSERVVNAAVAAAREAQVQLVIGFGGGSSMDVAKLAACLANPVCKLTLGDIYGVNTRRIERLPLLLVPTTAGTGSEVTSIAIVTTGEQTKAAVVNTALLADRVLLDAELTCGLPPAVTAATGIDAMVHAIEAYTGRLRKNPLSDVLAEQALRLLSENMLAVIDDGGDIEARERMLLGAMIAGQAFENSPVAAVHALAYPIGGIYHVAHGVSNALVLAHVLRVNRTAVAPLYARLAAIVCPQAKGDEQRRCDAFIDHMARLVERVGLPPRLRDVNIPEAALDTLAAEALTQQRLLANNPVTLTQAAIRDIYQAAY